MGNTTEIKLGKKTYKITFGMMANELFFGYQDSNNIPGPHKLIIDLIYSGIENECQLERSVPPKYRDIAEAIEDIFDTKDEDGLKQIANVTEVYNGSRAKRGFDAALESQKKKLAELESLRKQTTSK